MRVSRVLVAVCVVLALVHVVSVHAEGEISIDANGNVGGQLGSGIRVCGNYCGPDWCASQVKDETACVRDGSWSRGQSDGGCADSCCRLHDSCCGNGSDRHTCNTGIVNCLYGCLNTPCGLAVWSAMSIVKSWCCGSPCPKSMMLEIEANLRSLNVTMPKQQWWDEISN